MALLHLGSFVGMMVVVFAVAGWASTLQTRWYTDFTDGHPEQVASESTVTTELPLLAQGESNFNTQLAQLLLQSALYTTGLVVAPEAVLTADGTFGVETRTALLSFQTQYMGLLSEDEEFGSVGERTWMALFTFWNDTDYGQCAVECAVAAIAEPSLAFGRDPYDGSVGCCREELRKKDGWLARVIDSRLAVASASGASAENCVMPTLFNLGTLFRTCVDQDVITATLARRSWARRSLGFAADVAAVEQLEAAADGHEWQVPVALSAHYYHVLGVLMAFPLLTTTFHLFAALLLLVQGRHGYYAQMLLHFAHNPLRWLEYTFTSSVMLWVVAQISGISHIGLLLLMLVLNALIMLLGGAFHEWLHAYMRIHAVLQGRANKPPFIWWLPFALATAAYLYQWVTVFWYFFTAALSASTALPWFVYASVCGLFPLFSAFAMWQFMYYQYGQTASPKRWAGVPRHSRAVVGPYGYEVGFQVLSLTAKLFLTWILTTAALTNR